MEKLRPGLDPRTVHVGFVMDQEAMEQVFLPVLMFSPVSIIPSMLNTDFVFNLRCVTPVLFRYNGNRYILVTKNTTNWI
jgi:hypothetical protein